jgi:non-ribosomal peptide synthetase component E (peptide arylation enzyme)
VIAEPDPVLGEKSHAVVFAPKATLTAEDVRVHCRRFLSDYKSPDFVTFVDEPLPRNANGKILKRALPSREAQESGKRSAPLPDTTV